MMQSFIIIGLMYLIQCTVSTTTTQYDIHILKDAVDSSSTSLANPNASATTKDSDSTTASDVPSTAGSTSSSRKPAESEDPLLTASNELREIHPLTGKHKTIFFISAATTFFILICSACISNLCDYSKLSKKKLARSHA